MEGLIFVRIKLKKVERPQFYMTAEQYWRVCRLLVGFTEKYIVNITMIGYTTKVQATIT